MPGSTPQTDATNLSVAAAMDRGDAFDRGVTSTSTTTSPSLSDSHVADIMARRTQLASQKQDLMNTLATTRMDDTKKRSNILNTWHSLDAEDNNLLREHQIVTTDAAKTAHENLVRQTGIQASNGLAKVINGIAGINEPMGSDAHTLAALKILGDTTDPEIAAARGHPGFDKILGPFAEQAKKSALTAERIKEATDAYKTATGLDPESVETTATGGINIRGKTSEGAKTIPATAYTQLGKINAEKASKQLYADREVDPKKKLLLQKDIDALGASIDAWHQTYTGTAGKSSAAAAPVPNNYTSESDFTSAFGKAKSGDVLTYNGKPYKKP